MREGYYHSVVEGEGNHQEETAPQAGVKVAPWFWLTTARIFLLCLCGNKTVHNLTLPSPPPLSRHAHLRPQFIEFGLGLDQVRVNPPFGDEFVVAADFGDFAFVDDHQAGGVA